MKISQSKILITGGAGYVGSVLIPELLKAGARVRVMDCLMFGGRAILPFFQNKSFSFQRGDVRNENDLKKALEGIDIVIHLAALVGYPICKKEPVLAEEVNYGGTVLLDKLRGKIPVVYASTGSNYGALVGDVCREETPLNPLTVYGVTKTKAEQQLLKSGNCVCYRFATAFGVSNRMRLDLLLNDFVYQAVKNKNLIVYERKFKRTFINVFDMARAFIFAIENLDRMRGQVFNVGSGKLNYSKEEIANILRAKFDFYLHYAEVGTDEDKRNYEVCYDKIHSLGFNTTVTVEEGIEQLINAYNALEITHDYSNV